MCKLTVLNPAVSEAVVPIAPAQALARIDGARIGFVDNSKQNADLFLGRLKPLLTQAARRPAGRHRAQAGAQGSAHRCGSPDACEL
jgi:hypothetical protein